MERRTILVLAVGVSLSILLAGVLVSKFFPGALTKLKDAIVNFLWPKQNATTTKPPPVKVIDPNIECKGRAIPVNGTICIDGLLRTIPK